MTKHQADAAVALLVSKYPDAAIETEDELEADADDSAPGDGDFSVAAGGTVADTIDELVAQVQEDFGDDPDTAELVVQLEALSDGGLLAALHDDDPDLQVSTEPA